MEKGKSGMRIATLAVALMAGLAAAPASAQFVGPGSGGRGGNVTTVAEAADARIDTRAVLEGHIVDHQRRDYFTFRDETGTMTAEIERILFLGRKVTPETRVRLHGEIGRSFSDRRYIEVRRLEVLD